MRIRPAACVGPGWSTAPVPVRGSKPGHKESLESSSSAACEVPILSGGCRVFKRDVAFSNQSVGARVTFFLVGYVSRWPIHMRIRVANRFPEIVCEEIPTVQKIAHASAAKKNDDRVFWRRGLRPRVENTTFTDSSASRTSAARFQHGSLASRSQRSNNRKKLISATKDGSSRSCGSIPFGSDRGDRAGCSGRFRRALWDCAHPNLASCPALCDEFKTAQQSLNARVQ